MAITEGRKVGVGILAVETGVLLETAPEDLPPVVGLHLRPIVLGGTIGGSVDHQAADVVDLVVDALRGGAPPHFCKVHYTKEY
jgi:hypothetical protein